MLYADYITKIRCYQRKCKNRKKKFKKCLYSFGEMLYNYNVSKYFTG